MRSTVLQNLSGVDTRDSSPASRIEELMPWAWVRRSRPSAQKAA
jgi:hypothetical protein